jgi:hypothetical protein
MIAVSSAPGTAPVLQSAAVSQLPVWPVFQKTLAME